MCLRLGRSLWGLVALLVCTRSEQLQDFLADFFKLETKVHQDLRGNAVVLTQETEQQMLSADIVMVEIARFFDRVLNDLLGARRLWQLAHGHHLGAALDELLHFEANLAQIDIEVLQDIGANARAFFHQTEQDVLSTDVLVVEALCFLVSQGHDLAGAISESFKHFQPPSWGVDPFRRIMLRFNLTNCSRAMLGIATGVRADIECNWLATPNPPMVGSVHGSLLLSDLCEFPGIGADFSGKTKAVGQPVRP